MNDKGFLYLASLSFSVIDRCDLPMEEKKSLLYSAYSFFALFEEEILYSPDKILIKNGICFAKETDIDRVPFDCLMVEEGDKKILRYDIGSESCKKFSGIDEPAPNKLGLYDMVYRIVTCSTATDELKAMWYIYFPYIPLTNAPLDHDVYAMLKKVMLSESLYKKVLESKYSDIIYDSIKEMVLGGVDPIVTDWYVEYVEWKNVKNEKGVSREVEKYQKYLAKGDFEYVLKGTEKLLNTFPTDQEILLMNIASRVSLGNQNKRLLEEALLLIDETLRRLPKKKEYFLYYKGLCKMGLGDIDEAKKLFEILDGEYHFELATFMLSALSKYKGEKI